MHKREINKNFGKWRQSQVVGNASEEEIMRLAFAAGCEFVEKNKFKAYRFKAGRWIVTVEATSIKDAKAIASARLNRRAEKLSATPPVGGWSLQLLET